MGEFQDITLDEFRAQTHQGDDIELTPETTTEIWDKLVELFGDTGSHELHEVLCYKWRSD
jgi:hypothetical protein